MLTPRFPLQKNPEPLAPRDSFLHQICILFQVPKDTLKSASMDSVLGIMWIQQGINNILEVADASIHFWCKTRKHPPSQTHSQVAIMIREIPNKIKYYRNNKSMRHISDMLWKKLRLLCGLVLSIIQGPMDKQSSLIETWVVWFKFWYKTKPIDGIWYFHSSTHWLCIWPMQKRDKIDEPVPDCV